MTVKITKTAFVTSVYKLSQLPSPSLPEVAFAGKSNVGKSCLLNRLLGRRNLVKISSRPGFTQSLNFFLVNDSVHFVDLPGYGFAKAPKHIQQKWHRLVEGYIEARKPLKGVVCIFDIRRVPDQLDLDLLGYLHALGRHIWLVLNKADKISKPKRQKQIQAVCRLLPGFIDKPLIISARTGEGVQSLLETIWLRIGEV
ncbi:MAG: YihA family ribosome biogenesis GTP-binding protein [Deltaproteobacteria bacterium]|nr:YihA family ribosome biogenesis GTP-binding protein [Deltaproteobacteria bacterium]